MYIAQYEIKQFTVRFYELERGNLYASFTVNYGEVATYTVGTQLLSFWTFGGWRLMNGSAQYGQPIYEDTDYYAWWYKDFPIAGTLPADDGSSLEFALVNDSKSKIYPPYYLIGAALFGKIQHTAHPTTHTIDAKIRAWFNGKQGYEDFLTMDTIATSQAFNEFDVYSTHNEDAYTTSWSNNNTKLKIWKSNTCTVKWYLNLTLRLSIDGYYS